MKQNDLLRPARKQPMGRRSFLQGSLVTGGAALTGGLAAGLARPAIVLAESRRPKITHGLQAGDVGGDRGILWARADRPSRLIAEVATRESFADARTIEGPTVLEGSDFTAKLPLEGLPADQEIFYRLRFQDLADINVESEPMTGRFRSAPAARRDVSFVWSGDTAGQGWGINPEWGGMKIYETMRGLSPDFFIHSGDTIYADGPIQPEVTLEDGSVWKNVTLEEKAKNAETLDEFRASYRYNLMDENLKRFYAEVPVFAQWDDHETVNNWYPQEILDRDDYKVKSVPLLAARAKQAFFEYMPIPWQATDLQQVHRVVRYGPSLDVFFLDMRTFRGPNSPNRQAEGGAASAFLGAGQLAWLKRELMNSKATWKVIAADMPIGILVRDGESDFENGANGDGPALGRELEIADLLRFIKHAGVKNVAWFTADVHYTAAHYYDPNQAQFQDFEPFWEFVSGPLNAGTFGPGEMDNTFGPQVRYVKAPEAGRRNLPPSEGLQFFGHATIDGESEVMTVRLNDLTGETLWSVDLTPEA